MGKRSVLLFLLLSLCLLLSVTFVDFSFFVSGETDTDVSNETELRNAIYNAQAGKSVVIALDQDITLTESTLTIPVNKDITAAL